MVADVGGLSGPHEPAFKPPSRWENQSFLYITVTRPAGLFFPIS